MNVLKLRKFKDQYENALTIERFQEAENYLLKVHDKFGTIEESLILKQIR